MKQLKMNDRQWRLFDLITLSHEQGIERLTQKDICELLPSYYAYNERPNDKCPLIWEDVDFINKSLEVDKIIVVDKFTYRFGSKSECEDYGNKLLIGALKKLKRAWAVIDKVKRDGQGKLLSNQNNPIDDKSRAKRYIETFIDNHIDEIMDDEEKPSDPKPTEPIQDERYEQLDLMGFPILKGTK